MLTMLPNGMNITVYGVVFGYNPTDLEHPRNQELYHLPYNRQ